MVQRFAPTHGMAPTPSGQYVLASDAETLQNAIAEAVRVAGDYFDMVERGEMTAAQARAALAAASRLDMALLVDGAGEPDIACLIHQEGDWTLRTDPPHGGEAHHRRHVHIRKRGLAGEYSWNEDGTRHDQHRFPASEQCIRAAKEKAARVLRVPVGSLQLVLSERGPLRASARTGQHRSIQTAPSLALRVRSSYSLIVLGTPAGVAVLIAPDA